ncbi:MAG TPA: tRNA lysidine(34) synthetase TilS [Bryobacteraceae bacterium]|nr:tRNA lysidine(34) synthetase TilS [Bryobacteraceae bacterium]
MLNRITQFVAKHHMFPTGTRVGVAVSGGADSVFLLHALRELAPRWEIRLSVVHIEHGIRGAASLADAEFVRQLADSFQLPFHIHHANVPAIDDNEEQAARQVRLDFYAELLASVKLDRIATGHTRNDQAETVFYRILRGSGLAGLAGILPVTREGVVRPLLEIDRSEIEAWLRDRNIGWREDATNQDRSYARNRLRHEVLPALRENFNPRLDEALSNMAALAQDEERYWQSELTRLQPSAAGHQPLILETSHIAAAPPAVARRLIRRAIEHAKGDLRQIDFAHVERVLEMARSEEGHDRVQLPGLDIIRSFGWMRLAPLKPANARKERDFSLPLAAPGSVELPGSSARITLQVLEKAEYGEPYATVGNELDWQRLRPAPDALPSLELRNWRPGDQYRRVGKSKDEKIKFLFQEARVPLWERRDWPIITYEGTILWTRRFGAAADFAAGPSTRVVLQVRESDSSESGIVRTGSNV